MASIFYVLESTLFKFKYVLFLNISILCQLVLLLYYIIAETVVFLLYYIYLTTFTIGRAGRSTQTLFK